MTPATGTRHVGSVLGERYELVRHIASDGVSDVYEGQDRLLQRSVAVKVYRSSGPADRSGFDAEVASLLDDPSVQVYDAGEWSDDGGYVVVESAHEPTLLATLSEPAPQAVMVGDRTVDGDDPTTVIALGDHTAVMPAILRPHPRPEEAADTGAPAAAAAGANRALWLALAAIALVVVLLASQGGGGIEVPPPTTEPVAVTSPPPTTTSPPTTAAPAERPDDGNGNGKGKGRGDKDDD